MGLKIRLNRSLWKLKRTANSLTTPGAPSWKTLRPLKDVATVAILLFAVFVLAGGVYVLVQKPLSILPQPSTGGWTFIYPGTIQEQTLSEGLVSAIVYAVAFLGLFMLFKSTRSVYRPRQAYLLLILGLIIVLFSIFYMGSLLSSKIS